MFVILMKKVGGNWFAIWHSEDAADTANYLKTCVEVDSLRPDGKKAEYRMLYVVKEVA